MCYSAMVPSCKVNSNLFTEIATESLLCIEQMLSREHRFEKKISIILFLWYLLSSEGRQLNQYTLTKTQTGIKASKENPEHQEKEWKRQKNSAGRQDMPL